ncbi:MAG: formate hydrogenase [Chloroflexales bacterium]|nr:formate hydrogenase [Chloroflexales bacterium]
MHLRVARPEVVSLAQMLRDEFQAELTLMVANDRRADQGRFEVVYLFACRRENWFAHVTVEVPADDATLVSLATYSYPASRFEREIFDMFGIVALDHPDPRPLVRHAFWPADYFPLRKDAVPPEAFDDDGTPFPFAPVTGEGVYEIPVGPVHAGIIEPGHFRFSVVGETILMMKERLYYTHKGTEKLFEGRAPLAGLALAERISGDTTVGHAMAYCEAIERLGGVSVPERGRYLRVVLLELERLYNHIADVGAICNDTGFAVAHAHCLRLRERVLRLNKRITGSRLLRDGVMPGGVQAHVRLPDDLGAELAAIRDDFDEVVEISLGTTMLLDRLVGTGCLDHQVAADHGALGYVGRASGIDHDVRRDHPFAAYGQLAVQVAVQTAGDVHARTLVRIAEAREAVRLITYILAIIPEGPLAAQLEPLPAYVPAFGMVEGWRGAIIHWVMADATGALSRVKIKDPSFVNWQPLALALQKNIVPDFPLCNKSFNQSYSGNDL